MLIINIKEKGQHILLAFYVVLGGFEPPQTEPKPVVLPLHHRTIQIDNF